MTGMVSKAISWITHRGALLLNIILMMVIDEGCTTRRSSNIQDTCQQATPLADTAPTSGGPSRRPNVDVQSTSLDIDLAARRGVATVILASGPGSDIALEVDNLVVQRVRDEIGPLQHRRTDGWLWVTPRAPADTTTVIIEYLYRHHDTTVGATTAGSTITWPDHCGNLFPCNSAPSDGATYRLSLTGIPEGLVAVYPEVLAFDSPSYAVAWAVGPLERIDLGTTTAGTELSLWAARGDLESGRRGTEDLVAAFDWFERTLGPYPFGSRAGSVAVDWPGSGFGGMEHHPFWHIERAALEHAGLHIHEAAHGWFGNGVRLLCWQDFVLSEGVVSYLTARAIEAVRGEVAAEATWNRYRQRLDRALREHPGVVAWPSGCGEIDVERDLFNGVPYMMGAHFLRALERRVGRQALDDALAETFRRYVGRAASVENLLALILERTGYDARACAEDWLRATVIPDAPICPAAPSTNLRDRSGALSSDS